MKKVLQAIIFFLILAQVDFWLKEPSSTPTIAIASITDEVIKTTADAKPNESWETQQDYYDEAYEYFEEYTEDSESEIIEDMDYDEVETSEFYEEDTGVSESGRIEELSHYYTGTCVVDGEFDSDKTFMELCEAVEKHRDSIIIYHGTENVICNIEKFLAMNDYRFFWLEGWCHGNGEDYIKIDFQYLVNIDETDRMKEQIDCVYSDILYGVEESTDGSMWGAAKYVYDYLVREVTYDKYNGSNIRNIYGTLIEKKAVCKGYAASFDYIMSRMGFDVGVAGNENHIWNYLNWNSKDCFIDVTWGDPDEWDAFGNYYVTYSYMGLDVNELLTLDDHCIEFAYISGRSFCDSDVGFECYYGEYEGNYCSVCGLIVDTYSYEMIEDIFYRQIYENENSLIVKFSDKNTMYAALDELLDNEQSTLNQILVDIGFYGTYRYSYNEACNSFIVYLNAQ